MVCICPSYKQGREGMGEYDSDLRVALRKFRNGLKAEGGYAIISFMHTLTYFVRESRCSRSASPKLLVPLSCAAVL